MNQGRQNGAPDTPRGFGAVRMTQRGPVIELYFPPLRAAGSSFLLALFGAACCVIGGAAISGLVHSSTTFAANLLALAFAGVFALPLVGLGLWFIVIAVWTAANSVSVEVSTAGLHTERRWLGYAFARRSLARDEIMALDVKLAAKYIGAFGAARYYRLIACGRDRPLLIADSLRGVEAAERMRNIIIEHLEMPGLAARSNKVPGAEGDES